MCARFAMPARDFGRHIREVARLSGRYPHFFQTTVQLFVCLPLVVPGCSEYCETLDLFERER